MVSRQRIPDALTAGRLLLTPLFLWLLVEVEGATGTDPARMGAAVTLVVIGASDFLDGLLARRLGVVTRRGGMLDAAADKLAALAPLFYWALARPDVFPPVPLWLPLGLLGLDLVMVALWLGARRRHGRAPESRHNTPGRLATLLVFVLLMAVTLRAPAVAVPTVGGLVVLLRVVATAGYGRAWFGEGARR